MDREKPQNREKNDKTSRSTLITIRTTAAALPIEGSPKTFYCYWHFYYGNGIRFVPQIHSNFVIY